MSRSRIAAAFRRRPKFNIIAFTPTVLFAVASGGTVTAESAGRDRGATFRVRLPVRPVTKPVAHPERKPAHSLLDPRKQVTACV